MPALEYLDLSSNPDTEVVFSPTVGEFEESRVITNTPIDRDPTFVSWLMWTADEAALVMLREAFVAEFPDASFSCISEYLFQLMALTSEEYIDNMKVEKEFQLYEETALENMERVFRHFVIGYSSSNSSISKIKELLADKSHHKQPPRFFKGESPSTCKPMQLKSKPIDLFTVPSGTTCNTCQAKLESAYYFGVGSRLHRCIECTESLNAGTTNQMKLYKVNENSVLVTSPEMRTIDEKRMGKNIQPKSEDECLPYEYTCDGCGNHCSMRYMCMGCRREPTVPDYVDLCIECQHVMMTRD